MCPLKFVFTDITDIVVGDITSQMFKKLNCLIGVTNSKRCSQLATGEMLQAFIVLYLI